MNENLAPLLDAFAAALAPHLAAIMNAGTGEKLYTVEELAERYGLSKAAIRTRILAGEFGETVNVGTRTHRVTDAGRLYFEAQHTGPAYDGSPQYKPHRRRKAAAPGEPARI